MSLITYLKSFRYINSIENENSYNYSCYLVVFLITLTISCTHKKQELPIETINFDLGYEVKDSNSLTTTYFKERRIVKLETTNESLLAEISRLVVFNNRLYIFDRQTKSVYVFDESGKYISKIKCIGRGPGEYLQITDFTIDTKNRKIILLCSIPKCLMYFDLECKFQKKEPLDGYYKFLTKDQNSTYYASMMVKENDKYITVKNAGICAQFLPVEDFITNKVFYSIHPNLIRSEHTYYFKVYDNVVYELKNGSVIPRYQLNFGDKFIDVNTIKENSLENIVRINDKICRISDFRESGNYLTFATFPYSRIVVYNKKSRRSEFIKGFYDPETDLNLYEIMGYDGSGDEMMFLVSPSSFICMILETNKKKETEQSKAYMEMKEIAQRTKKTDNPLLLIYKLK